MKSPDTLGSLIQLLKEEELSIKNNYGVEKLGIFGSYVRNEARPDSDVDILVSFNRKIDFFKYLELEERLSAIVHQTVDLVEESSLKPRIKENILKEVEYL